jgi:hypothetical protein
MDDMKDWLGYFVTVLGERPNNTYFRSRNNFYDIENRFHMPNSSVLLSKLYGLQVTSATEYWLML